MTGNDVPFLPRGVRLHYDKVRGTNVLLGPERALILDDISNIILAQLDGERSVDAICKNLAETYAAPLDQIATDTLALLTDLANKRLLEARCD
ncbi:MAG: pyrroloquinoline quinone biosynthesis peptide chaperone PqqD [Roseobacter sp.]|uniref:pyrroloquinoline quinone biosynthesis peptide chaperone PqqD n=1 Tax=Tateyamaria sp. TaxID=1929288 RepID=UPI0032962B52